MYSFPMAFVGYNNFNIHIFQFLVHFLHPYTQIFALFLSRSLVSSPDFI